MKIVKSLVLATAIALPAAAMAAKPAPGLYLVGGLQTLCIVADGTWYGVSYSPWSGQWSYTSKTLLMRGNYTAGNDAMNFKGSTTNGFTGDWQEWTDDQSYEYAQASTLVFQSATCAASSVQGGSRKHPSEQ